MLKVNVIDMRAYSKELRKRISSYETISMSILQEVRNLDTEWKDDNSEKFFALSDTQKKEIAKLVSSIENVCDRYDSIASSTIAIDASIETIFCNQTYKGLIKNKYDSALSKINSIINKLENCTYYFCTWGERNAINNAKSSLYKAADRIRQSANKVDKMFTKLTKLETYITEILNGINIEPIPELDLSQFLR